MFKKGFKIYLFAKFETGYYVSPDIDQFLKFKNHCSLTHMHHETGGADETVFVMQDQRYAKG